MRVALVRDLELPGGEPGGVVSDAAIAVSERCREDVREALEAAGHEVAATLEVGHEVSSWSDALVVVLTPETRGLATREVPVDRPCVAVIATDSDPRTRGFDGSDRSSLETFADAYALGARRSAEALAWATSESRSERATGAPRLVVVGSINDDFGMVRSIPAEPLILGRAMSFGEHPQRPDRLPTPVGSIARHHARVRCVDGVIEVADLASTNGTIVLRRGEPARLLCPQQADSGRAFGPPASDWLRRDPRTMQPFVGAWHGLAIGDELQLPGYWRFRVDGDAMWKPDD